MKNKILTSFYKENTQIKLGRNIWLIILTGAAAGFTIYDGIYAVLFNIYLLRLGYGTEFIGILSSVDSFTFTVFAFVAGILGQRWGMKRAMLFGVALMTLATFLILFTQAFAATVATTLFVIIALLRGIGTVTFSVINIPYLMAHSSDDTRDQAVTFYETGYSIAAFLGGMIAGLLPGLVIFLLGGTLEEPSAYRYPFILAALIMLLALWFVWQAEDAPYEKGIETDSFIQTLRLIPDDLKWTLAIFTLISLLGGMGICIPLLFGIVYLDDALQTPINFIGIFSALSFLVAAFAVFILPFLIKRWSLLRVILITHIVTAFGTPLISMVEYWPIAGIIYVAIMGINHARFTAYRIYTMAPIPEKYQSFASGLFTMSLGLGFSGMSLIVGLFITRIGYLPLFLASGLIMLFTAFVIWLYETWG